MPAHGPTREQVALAVAGRFPREDASTLLEVLDLYGAEPHEGERERVQLAIIALSDGDLDTLLDLIQCAKRDYRDVLYWYDLASGAPDPVGERVTGLTLLTPELTPKRLELLTEAVPNVARVAILWNPGNESHPAELRALDVVAAALGVQVEPVPVQLPLDFEGAFRAIDRAGTDGLLVLSSAVHQFHLPRIAELALKNRSPAICELTDFADAGGLMSYGPSPTDMPRRAVARMEALLRGRAPADRGQPRVGSQLVINLRTARALGLAIPAWLLTEARRVIG